MSIWTGVKIWAITILINALAWLLISLFTINMPGVLMAVLFLMGGLFFTMPLLLVIVPLVYFSCKLPYNIKSKITWLGFYLMGLVYLVLTVFAWLLGEWDTDFFVALLAVGFMAVPVSLYLNRGAIIKLDNELNRKQTNTGAA